MDMFVVLVSSLIAIAVLLYIFWMIYKPYKKQIRDFWHNFFEQYIVYTTPYLRWQHNRKIAQLRKKFSSFPKPPSTTLRAFGVIFASLISIGLGYLILDCLGQTGGCADLKVLHIDKLDSKVLSSSAVLLISAPILFVIWLYRDMNKLKEMEQQRKDTNLKEFQKLQEWATGNIDNKYNDDGSIRDDAIALQISALHSLRGYLKGEYGESFRRGAFEIFTSVLKEQHQKILSRIKHKLPISKSEIVDAIERDKLASQINRIVREEWFNLLVNHSFPTASISLVGVDLRGAYLRHRNWGESVDLSFSNLQGADLSNAILRGANLTSANLNVALLEGAQCQGTNLRFAQLKCVYIVDANFDRADLSSANLRKADSLLGEATFRGASLLRSSLEFSDLPFAQFQGAWLEDANLSGAMLIGAEFQGASMKSIKLAGADLSNARLQGANNLRDFQSPIERIQDHIGQDATFSFSRNDYKDEELERIKRDLTEFSPLSDEEIKKLKKSNGQYKGEGVVMDAYSSVEAEPWIRKIQLASIFKCQADTTWKF